MDNHFISTLRCPITLGRVGPAGAQLIQELNVRIGNGDLFNQKGEKIRKPITEVLVNDAGSYAYLFKDNIYHLLPESAIPLHETAQEVRLSVDLESFQAKKSVQTFYEEGGWEADGDHFLDAALYEDLRPVAEPYIRKCHMKVRQFIPPSGKYLLDVASGPIQYDEYLIYSQNYEKRICGDISVAALKAAQKRLPPGKGIFVLCDITALPFQSDSIDTALSLHTIYHVPAQQQTKAIQELHRVVSVGGRVLIVYNWNRRKLLKPLARAVRGVYHALKPAAKRKFEEVTESDPGLYHKNFSYQYFKQSLGIDFKVVNWRTFSVPVQKLLIRPKLGGKALLSLFYQLEISFPELWGRIGNYPLFILEKETAYEPSVSDKYIPVISTDDLEQMRTRKKGSAPVVLPKK
ncbi:MAG: methyltransferase domain-containing protein [Bacteroidota bacterium]